MRRANGLRKTVVFSLVGGQPPREASLDNVLTVAVKAIGDMAIRVSSGCISSPTARPSRRPSPRPAIAVTARAVGAPFPRGRPTSPPPICATSLPPLGGATSSPPPGGLRRLQAACRRSGSRAAWFWRTASSCCRASR